jgi:MFS family permease
MSTLSFSLIWGINTLFLLSAGLSNLQAFTANAFFTAGQVLFELPTGVIADSWGRQTSYLLGALTLTLSTLLYVLFWYIKAPFWMWGLVSVFIGLGFTFFSGAMEAWLIDALGYTKYMGDMEPVFAKGQVASGASMLLGSVTGGIFAQFTNLGIPYVLRGVLLIIVFVIAYLFMKDLRFTPTKPQHPLQEMKKLFTQSVTYSLKNRPIRWLMVSTPFTTGASIYAFYALQPYLLELYGNPNAYSIAGLAAAAIAGAQIVGGLMTPVMRNLFKRRTTILLSSICLSSLGLFLLGTFPNFYLALIFGGIWAISFAISNSVYLSLINTLIPSEQRATVLSFNNLMGSSGGVVSQPALGQAADVFGYAVTYIMTSVITFMGLVFILFARSENINEDRIVK